MKKIFLSLMIIVGGFISAQDYYDTYPTNNGYEYYNDNYDYPDDYYYNYPNDYYPNDYYNSYYGDYTKSITSVNWNRFFIDYNLSPLQVNEIIRLNNRFTSYNAWDSYYRYNPDRWYYDRFYALQNILGPKVYAIYERNYYKGSPIVYFQNYRQSYYVVHYNVVPRYRNVNINNYKINRTNFRDYYKNNRLDGMLSTNQNSWVRNNSNFGNNNGFRNVDNGNSGFRNTNSVRTSDNNGGGFRNTNQSNNDGFRNTNTSVSRDSGNSGFRNSERGTRNGSASESSTTSTLGNGGFRSGGSSR